MLCVYSCVIDPYPAGYTGLGVSYREVQSLEYESLDMKTITMHT